MGVLVLLLLLIVLFGSLGIFIAKVFLLAAAITVLVSVLTGGYYYVGRR